MYLLYDVLQLRRSALGHKLLIKHQKWKKTMSDIASLTASQLENAVKALASRQKIEDATI